MIKRERLISFSLLFYKEIIIIENQDTTYKYKY